MNKNFFYYILPSAIQGILGLFVIIPVSTYYLGPRDFGIIAIITIFAGLTVPISSVAVGWVLGGSYYRLSDKDKKELIFNAVFLGFIIRALAVLLFAAIGKVILPILVTAYEPVFLTYYYLLLFANLLGYLWEITSYVIILQKKGKAHAFISVIPFCSNLIILLLCLVIIKLKTISLVFGILAEAAVSFALCFIYLGPYIKINFNLTRIKEVARSSFLPMPLNLFDYVSNSIERFFIERWLGLYSLGIYSHSLLYKKMFMMPLKAFSNTYSPMVLESISADDQIKLKDARIFLKRWFGLIAVIGLAVILYAREIIDILTHGKFVEAAPLVSLWYVLILIYSFGIPYTQFFYAHKKMKFIIISQMSLGIFSWLATALFVKLFGIIGATIAILLYILVLYIFRKAYAMRLGCISFENIYFWLYILFALAVIAFNLEKMPEILKIILFLGSSFFISHRFGLFSYLKFLKKKNNV